MLNVTFPAISEFKNQKKAMFAVLINTHLLYGIHNKALVQQHLDSQNVILYNLNFFLN